MGNTSTTVTKLETVAAKKVIEQIRGLFEANVENTIELAYQLEAFFGGSYHHALGYANQADCIEECFECSPAHVYRLKSVAYNARELGYTQKQIETIYARTGHLSALRFYLSNLSEKRPVSEAVKTLRQTEYHTGEHVTYNIGLRRKEAKELDKVLTALGMEKSANGRRSNVHESAVALIALSKKALKIK